MWLPGEKILAAGDIVVSPVPYGHGGHPAEWAQTLKKIAGMDFTALVPGHGPVQTDLAYVDLLIETLQSIAGQIRHAVASGLSIEETRKNIDLSVLADRFTHGDAFLRRRFDEWFAGPIIDAGYKLESGKDPEILPPRN